VSATRRQFLGAGLQLASLAGCGAFVTSNAWAARAEESGRIEARALANGLWLLTGAGCNVLAVQGAEGALLVDGGYARHAKALLKAVSTATGKPRVATLINTHWHPAQTGANESVGKAGGEIIAHAVTAKYLARAVTSIDYEGKYGPLQPAGRPAKRIGREGSLQYGGRMVQFGYLPAAHTDGDLYVHLPEQNLLVTGGPVQSESWPLMDYRNGAWLGGLVKGQEKLASLVRPDTVVIPANGRVMTGAEMKQHHERIAAFHEQMVVFQNKGMDSGDCVAARPLKAFEAEFGDATAFVVGAFHSLNLAYSPD